MDEKVLAGIKTLKSTLYTPLITDESPDDQGCIKCQNASRELAGIKTVFTPRGQINLL